MQLYLLIANAVMAALVAFKWNSLPPEVPLLYSRNWGEGQVVDLWFLFIIPLLMNVFFFLNNYLVRRYFAEEEYIKKSVHYFNMFLILAFTFIFARVVLLVT